MMWGNVVGRMFFSEFGIWVLDLGMCLVKGGFYNYVRLLGFVGAWLRV